MLYNLISTVLYVGNQYMVDTAVNTQLCYAKRYAIVKGGLIMKRIICLLVIVMTMLTASVCFAASLAGGSTKYYNRCIVQVNGPSKMIWDKMPAFILTVKNSNGTPGKARVDVYAANGNRIASYNAYNTLELKPRIVARKYSIKITPISSSNMTWRLEKNYNQVHNSYPYSLQSQKNTVSQKTSNTSSKSKGSTSPFDLNQLIRPAARG